MQCAEERKDHKGFLVARQSGESRCRSFEKRVEKSSTWLTAGDLQSPPSFLKPGQSRLAFAVVYTWELASTTSTASFSSTLIVFLRATPPGREIAGLSISRGSRIDSIGFSWDR